MQFCDKCGSRLKGESKYINSRILVTNESCPKCDNVEESKPNLRSQSTKEVPKDPIRVSITKPAPPYKQLTPYLEQISKYRQEKTGRNLSPNKSQREIITKIEDCIKNNKTRIVISAPTGCGKSWIAATLASAYGGVVLTSTNDLQDQYCGTEDGTPGDFNFMNAVRGKGQYLCEESGNTKNCNEAYCPGCDYLVYDEHVQIGNGGPLHEQKIFSKPEDELCKYFKADMIGKKSKYSVYSYASYIARMKAEKFKMEPDHKPVSYTHLRAHETLR